MENELCAPSDFRPTRESSALKDFGDRVPDHPVIPHKLEKWKDSGMGLNAPSGFRPGRAPNALRVLGISAPDHPTKVTKRDQAASMGFLPEYIQRTSDSYIQCA